MHCTIARSNSECRRDKQCWIWEWFLFTECLFWSKHLAKHFAYTTFKSVKTFQAQSIPPENEKLENDFLYFSQSMKKYMPISLHKYSKYIMKLCFYFIRLWYSLIIPTSSPTLPLLPLTRRWVIYQESHPWGQWLSSLAAVTCQQLLRGSGLTLPQRSFFWQWTAGKTKITTGARCAGD